MTSSSVTEGEVLKVLLSHPGSFEHIKSSLWKERKTRSIKPGSPTTISNALKSLHEKRFVEYDVTSRKWEITSLGRLIAVRGLKVPPSAKALTWVTQPLVNVVEKNPEQLVDLLSAMFVYFSMSGGKVPVSEELLLKQTKARLRLIGKGNSRAIGAIWVDGVELLIGHFSSLMAAILLYRSSSLEQNEAQASTTIHKIVEQWFRWLSVELASSLSKYLANLEDLAALEAGMNRRPAGTGRK
jgi:hypothetical protein